MSSATCLGCDGSILLRRVAVGQVVTCPHCKVQLEIVSDDPLEFYWMWEEDDDETGNDWAGSTNIGGPALSRM